MEYFNRYAFTYVAVYGQKYTEAASSVWGLLKSTGFMVIINDDLIEGVLVFGALLGGFALAAFGGLVSHYALGMTSWGLYAGLGFLVRRNTYLLVILSVPLPSLTVYPISVLLLLLPLLLFFLCTYFSSSFCVHVLTATLFMFSLLL